MVMAQSANAKVSTRARKPTAAVKRRPQAVSGKSAARATPGRRFNPIHRPSLAWTVREEILARILQGDFRPGDRIVEMRIAQELGTSQAPVREALRSLEMLGLVESSRNRGARVRMLDAKELAEITDIRAQLEGYAATLAATRLKRDAALLEAQIDAMHRAAKTGDMRTFAEANSAFHRIIVQATGNATLLDIWTRLDVRAHTIMNVLRGHRNLATVAESHRPIVDALRHGSSRTVRRALLHHILGLRLSVP